MSEGTGVPAEWTRQPAQPVPGQQPETPGQVPPGQPPVPPQQQGGPVPPPPGGFGPPATPYAQPGAGVPPQAPPPAPPHVPTGPGGYPPSAQTVPMPPAQPQPQSHPLAQTVPIPPAQPQPQPLAQTLPMPPAQPQGPGGPPPYNQWPQAAAPQSAAEPDWGAMADRHANESRKRKRLWIGAAALAAVVVGGVVAAGVWINGDGKGGDPKPAASSTPAGVPTEQALAVISDAATDKLPVDAATLFPDQTRTVDGKVWTRKVTGATSPCSKATTGGLGLALGDDTCRSLVRATYVSGDSAVTVGVAVFDNKAGADRALGRHAGLIQGLAGPGVAMFCVTDKSGCTETHAAIGRFGYFTVAGSLKQTPDQGDPVASTAGTSLADRTKAVLLGRAGHTG
ncbi:hypothetical protein ACFVVX_12150 [Kitasatospora sp. NPDC058170]|uniref:hypothetical protein n=1 Tax=Kitasatospora sp. NPDC058170 TaxID=3346364 RepID=UPI0036DB9AD1